MLPLVSIIMPAHNAADTIALSIESVITQTYQQWELLVIDDCSTDGTAGVAAAFAAKDSRVKILHTDQSVGKLAHQIPLFEEDDVAIAFSYYEKFSDGQEKSGKRRVVKFPESVSFKSALYGNPIGNLTGVYDTKKVGKVFYEDAGHEDYILWLTILKKGFVAKNTNSVEARYRVSEKSVSSDKGKAASWTWNIYRKTLGFGFVKSALCYSGYMIKGILKYLK